MPSVNGITPPPGEILRRQLGLGSAAAVVASEAIAIGIFLTPAGMVKSLASPFWLLIVWLAVGAMTLSGALCLGELAGRFPSAGGAYVYLRESLGPRTAFLYGWMSLLVLDPGLTAAFAVGFAAYTAYIFHWPPVITKLAAVAAIWGICALNIFSTGISAGFLRWITWLKFGVLATLTVWALALRLGSWSNFVPFVAQRPGALPLASALGAALVGAFFCFGGWWDAAKIAGEVRDPGRTLPRALSLGVIAVTTVYFVISTVFIYLVPIEKVSSDGTFVAQAGEVLFGPAGGIVFAAIVIVCVLGSLAAFIMSAPRVYYAMARDGLFLKSVARIHPRFGTPGRAIMVQGIIASILLTLGSFEQIISYFFFVTVLFLGLTVTGLFVIRRKPQHAEAIVPTAGYPFTPIAFLVLVVIMLILLAADSPREAALGCVVVLAGWPVFSWVRRAEK
ncbi:MAG TPA: amino acid permease [Candidatus Acidoferrales bacterium]|nr:amino acid permease [Candidatus Acidoferrales bacterium]